MASTVKPLMITRSDICTALECFRVMHLLDHPTKDIHLTRLLIQYVAPDVLRDDCIFTRAFLGSFGQKSKKKRMSLNDRLQMWTGAAAGGHMDALTEWIPMIERWGCMLNCSKAAHMYGETLVAQLITQHIITRNKPTTTNCRSIGCITDSK